MKTQDIKVGETYAVSQELSRYDAGPAEVLEISRPTEEEMKYGLSARNTVKVRFIRSGAVTRVAPANVFSTWADQERYIVEYWQARERR